MTIRPPRLRPGDTIAVVSLSWGGPAVFPAIYEAGLDTLRRLGLGIREMPTARMHPNDLVADPQARADDLNRAFADAAIAGVFATIGGDDSARILPHVDPVTILDHPKVLMGYSDTTAQLFFANQLGLVTFNGPSVMAGLAQARHFPDLEAHLRAILFEPTPTYDFRPYPRWVAQYADWSTTDDPTAVTDLIPHEGWRWINGTAAGRGRLAGGCMEVLEFLKGSRWWPDEDWWNDRILFIETSEEVPSVDQVRHWLFNYGIQGIFHRIAGLVVGRSRGYDSDQKRRLDEMIHSIVVEMFGAEHLPILTNADFGHTDPQWILPLGVMAELDPIGGTFRLLEPAVE